VAAVGATQTSSTRGLALLYHGAPVRAYYSSSSGGRTRDAQSAWGTAVPYLRSVSDPWSVDPSVNPGYAHWQRTVSRAKVATVFGLSDVESIEVTDHDRSGAAVTVTATASDGTQRSLGGSTLKSRLSLPAPWYSGFDLNTP
jgi:SpoIID/LytB domain protein